MFLFYYTQTAWSCSTNTCVRQLLLLSIIVYAQTTVNHKKCKVLSTLFIFSLFYFLARTGRNRGVTFGRSRMSGKTDTNSDNNSNQTRLFGEMPWNERNSTHRSSDADSMSREVVNFNNQINSLRDDLNVANNNNNGPQIIDSVAVINIDTNGKSLLLFVLALVFFFFGTGFN